MYETKELSTQEKFDYLRLIRSENVGPITFFKLIELFGSASEALQHAPELAKKGGKRKLKICSLKDAQAELKKAEDAKVRIIAFPEPDYPPLLRHVDDPPPILYVLGYHNLLRKKSVAIVGARNASALGKSTAKQFAYDLGASGVCIVSGLARGIDAAAHEGALSHGTIAVLGGGVDCIYPKENEQLYHQILEGSCIISEAPMGAKPMAKHFPRRNRIVSGMCRAILVVEAARASGSLITAKMALEQNREVFAVPGHPSDERARGCNKLIKDGAFLTEEAQDILSVINRDHFSLAAPQNIPMTGYKPMKLDETRLASKRKTLAEILSPSPTDVDMLLRELDCSYGILAHLLLELELAGKLERHPGNKVSFKP